MNPASKHPINSRQIRSPAKLCTAHWISVIDPLGSVTDESIRVQGSTYHPNIIPGSIIFPLYFLSRRFDGRSKRQNVTLKTARIMLYWLPRRCKSESRPSVFAFPRLLRSRELKKYMNETTGSNLKHVNCYDLKYLEKEAVAYLKSSFRRMDFSTDGSIVKK